MKTYKVLAVIVEIDENADHYKDIGEPVFVMKYNTLEEAEACQHRLKKKGEAERVREHNNRIINNYCIQNGMTREYFANWLRDHWSSTWELTDTKLGDILLYDKRRNK